MISLRRIAGILLIILAAISILISLIVVIQLWRYKQPATERLISITESFKTTFESTGQALAAAQDTLDSASATIVSLSLTLDALERAVESSQPMIESLRDLVESTLPDTVYSLQNSFEAAQESSRVIDTVLRSVTSIPFFPGDPYNPPVPLHESLANVSESMGELPNSFQAIEDSLTSTGGNLIFFKKEIARVKGDVSAIGESLDSSSALLELYQETVGNGLASIQTFQNRLPQLINITVWGLTFIFVWLAIFQGYLLIKGIELLRNKPEKIQLIIEEPAQLEARVIRYDETEDVL